MLSSWRRCRVLPSTVLLASEHLAATQGPDDAQPSDPGPLVSMGWELSGWEVAGGSGTPPASMPSWPDAGGEAESQHHGRPALRCRGMCPVGGSGRSQ